MRSTGEVMGIDPHLGSAFYKAYAAAGMKLPRSGRILITVKASDKRAIVGEARALEALGYELLATDGTYRAIRANGIRCERVNKVAEGRPHIVDLIKNREIALILNTPYGKRERRDDTSIRAAAVQANLPCITTLAGIQAVVSALTAIHRGKIEVRPLQDYHRQLEAERVPSSPARR
jgi:carbamoyl-phosphate synthase large subunit